MFPVDRAIRTLLAFIFELFVSFGRDLSAGCCQCVEYRVTQISRLAQDMSERTQSITFCCQGPDYSQTKSVFF
jgi:hypothetical protein